MATFKFNIKSYIIKVYGCSFSEQIKDIEKDRIKYLISKKCFGPTKMSSSGKRIE